MDDGPVNGGKVLRKERMRFVSAEQVAQMAGVSRSAVSRTFTPGASVAPATREKVLRAAEELGYHVNDLARGVLANQSRLVGMVATRPEVGFRAHLAAALAKALIRRGSIPILINTGQTEDELLAAQKMLIGHRAEAIIILSGSPPASFLELAQRNGQPLVVIGRSEPDADHVRAGNSEASRKAATAFYESGRRQLAVIGSNSGMPAIMERESAFVSAAKSLGASVVVARGDDSDYQGGVTAGRALLSKRMKPDAIFCANDLIAFGLMDVARLEARLRIPEDIAVIGFDDVPESSWLSYQLTTFRQDPVVMAQRAVDLMERRLENPDSPPAYERVIPELIIRQSFKP
ncbi:MULTISPECIES: LacI family DNA-binding transcriptional regulator [Rhizobium]|uniref:LacI family DNA-binding transcriptional regulator n=1 Tax=Rhizobium TaxID=379 RepID=UPI001B3429B4|nr:MULTISPECIES: LacI family DNA-binding transcriptional regulator [Rhizobium]MBX4906735.1 LacI family DNA-binding transcriptional regulator [Rhizobium bangladeshense]MBX5213233.1 LacI family DNA-binding transcriptional regulator [Rhizobium sp. NLR9a]MBX5230751.1 LacI family DNA-binding transcriptional regulator [Rhizobium sp. NLR4a]MBX5243500.1 LacI family DNA-binding transcriptional regulator [Rhizobium sp. NLR3b]MBX5251746.1 LacI family DNA-binding transcriptional regulator [Rhizobium sp. N